MAAFNQVPGSTLPLSQNCRALYRGTCGVGTLPAVIMIANAALFFFGAVQHAGLSLGPLHEPRIIPAAIVEGLCGVALLGGGLALVRDYRRGRRVALIGNLVALGGVLLGMAALAAGAGPRTSSNDLYHWIMLGLIGASLAMLLRGRRRPTAGQA